MKQEDVLSLYSIPAVSAGYGCIPHRFVNREFFLITYETDPNIIRAALPEPLEPDGSNTVIYEWIKMPDAHGLGSYQESGLVIPCKYRDELCNFSTQMYLDNVPAIMAGREILGFPKKFGHPNLFIAETETITGILKYNGITVAIGTMPYKYEPFETSLVEKGLKRRPVNLKIIPDVDCKPKIAQLTTYDLADVKVKEAWCGDARLHLVPHVNAPVADFPVQKIVGAKYFIVDLSIANGRVLHDYID